MDKSAAFPPIAQYIKRLRNIECVESCLVALLPHTTVVPELLSREPLCQGSTPAAAMLSSCVEPTGILALRIRGGNQ